ncbi:hypothetical protein BGZ54_005433, partial [Gamsiella multidivaricata]
MTTPAHLHPNKRVLLIKKPVFYDAPVHVQFFNQHAVSEWLPERFLKHGYGDLDHFFRGLKWIRQFPTLPQHLNEFCHHLERYYNSEDGRLTLELIRKAHLASKTQDNFHIAMDTALFKAADKRSAQ